MIFKQETVGVTVLDVWRLSYRAGRTENRGRAFSALSLRWDSETVLRCGGREYDVSDTVCYVPCHMPYTRLTRGEEMIVFHLENHTYMTSKPECFVPRQPARYRELFERAAACWEGKEEGYRLRTQAILYEILALAYEENRGSSFRNPLVEQAVRHIEREALHAELPVSELADALHISEAYLRRLFNREMGVSPKQYILRYRIHHAISLLESGYYSVAEVAEHSGFGDPKHFSVEFKKITGKSPSVYSYEFHR
ncbi:MAG: helix-turn-helix transcriptional regulator [Ruminococcaceae bacterium]|nr:helix-turn-helix transcriptional regulator [Oscillospiraceae bacterium]